MKIGLRLSSIEHSLDGQFYEYLFVKFLKFTPLGFRKGIKSGLWKEKKHRKEIIKIKTTEDLGIFDDQGNILHCGSAGFATVCPFQTVELEQDELLFIPTNEDVEEIINYSDGFVSAYLYNGEYEVVQSSVSETLYQQQNICKEILDTLNGVPFTLGVRNDKRYDVRFNPGRKILMGHTWLMAAHKMWFGEPFFKLVPKEKLLAFPQAVEVKELPTGQVYVHLFEKVDESHTSEGRFRQWEWQKWLDFDKLQEMYP